MTVESTQALARAIVDARTKLRVRAITYARTITVVLLLAGCTPDQHQCGGLLINSQVVCVRGK